MNRTIISTCFVLGGVGGGGKIWRAECRLIRHFLPIVGNGISRNYRECISIYLSISKVLKTQTFPLKYIYYTTSKILSFRQSTT